MVAIPYVVVGWCSLAVAPQLVRSLGWVGFALMLVAGAAYTSGALVYARKRPDPWPGVFGFHEVFHVSTVVGAGVFAYLVAFIALPRY
jgi:hemolysin III